MSSHSRSASSRRSGREQQRQPDAAAGGYGAPAAEEGEGYGGGYGAGYADTYSDGYRPVPATAAAATPGPSRSQARAAARARTRRRRRVRNGFLGVGSVAALTVMAVAGLLPAHSATTSPSVDAATAPSTPVKAAPPVPVAAPVAAIKQLPGLGPAFLAKVPASADQVLLVTGKAKNANTDTVVLYTRAAAGTPWVAGATWAAHNALDGWTTDHHAGDLHSPIGVFSLTDAGGLYSNPGTRLPYDHSQEFKAPGTGFEGESLADAFNYVVAINYNHVPGTSPLSPQRPMGADKGGGIWVHVDHGGPTHGCISLPQADMVTLLKSLDPTKHPVIVMGDAASLAA